MKPTLAFAGALAALVLGTAAAQAATPISCTNGGGDVVAYPYFYNNTNSTLKAGTKITYYIKAYKQKGRIKARTYVLTAALQPGKGVYGPQWFHWLFSCTAYV